MGVNTVPVTWKDETTLRYILCGNWATGGSVTVQNAGILNAPLNDLLSNDKYLSNILVPLNASYLAHLSDSYAHLDAIQADIALYLDGWSIPPQKIKDSLTETDGITNDDVQTDAAILESKLSLDLASVSRSSESSTALYLNTGEIAEDVQSLYKRLSGSQSMSDVSSMFGKAEASSGWMVDLPSATCEKRPCSLVPVGNRIELWHSSDTASVFHVLSDGIPYRFLLTMSLKSEEEAGNDKVTDLRNTVCELGVEGDTFGNLSSTIIYEASDGVAPSQLYRQDLVYMEFWKESIDPAWGQLFPFGNVQLDNMGGPSDVSAASFRYRHTDMMVPISSPSYSGLALDAENHVESDQDLSIVQRRFRVRLQEGADAIDQCGPQGIFPTSVDLVAGGVNYWTVSSVSNNVLTVSTSSVLGSLCAGDAVTFASLTTALPSGLAAGTTYYLVFDSSGVGTVSFKLAASYAEALDLQFNDESEAVSLNVADTLVAFSATMALEYPTEPLSGSELNLFSTLSGVEWVRPTGVSAGADLSAWGTGTPVVLSFDHAVVTHTDDALNSPSPDTVGVRYVSPSREGWISVFTTTTGEDPEIDKYQFDKSPEGLLRIESFEDSRVFEEVLLSEYTVNVGSGEVRSSKPWGSMQRVKISVSDCPSYIQLDGGEVLYAGDVCFLVNSETAEPTVCLARTYSDAACGNSMKSWGFRGVSALSFGYSLKYYRKSGDAGAWSYKIPVVSGHEECEVTALPMMKLHRRNAGVYHPIYNPNGTALFVNEVSSLRGAATLASVADCFKYENIVAFKYSATDPAGRGYSTLSAIVAQANPVPVLPFNYGTVSGTKWYRSGYSCFVEEGSCVGISGRPDGLFYDVADPRDILDERSQTLLSDSNLEGVLLGSLDSLFRGALRSEWKEQLDTEGEASGLKGSNLLQVDILKGGTDLPACAGTVLEGRRGVSGEGSVRLSFDELDNVRRVWSDRPVVQYEVEDANFGSSFPTSVYDGLDVWERGVGDFDTSLRLFASAPYGLSSPILLQYLFWKYRTFDGIGGRKSNGAFVGVRLARVAKGSGDYEGAYSDDLSRSVLFPPALGEKQYLLSREVMVDGSPVMQELETSSVTLANGGRLAVVESLPFSIPRPLRENTVYWVFEYPEGSGYFRLATSLSPLVPADLIQFEVDAVVAATNPILITPEFGDWSESVQGDYVYHASYGPRGKCVPGSTSTFNVKSNWISLRRELEVGTEVVLGFNTATFNPPDTLDEPLSVPKGLQGGVYYAVPAGKVVSDGETRYKVKLATSKSNAELGICVDFGSSDLSLWVASKYNSESEPSPSIVWGDISVSLRSGSSETIGVFKGYDTVESVDPEGFANLLTGTPVGVSVRSGSIPSPLNVSNTFYVIKLSDDSIQLAETLQDAVDSVAVSLDSRSSELVVVTPLMDAVESEVPDSGSCLVKVPGSEWFSGARVIFGGAPDAAFNFPVGSTSADPFWAISVDDTHVRFATTLVNVGADSVAEITQKATGQVVSLTPSAQGVVGPVQSDEITTGLFEWDPAWKFEVLSGSAIATGSYYASLDVADSSKIKFSTTYSNAVNGVVLGSLTNTSSTRLLGYPAYVEAGDSSGTIHVPAGSESTLVVGTPVEVVSYSDVAKYSGQLVGGLSRNKVYYVYSVSSGSVVLADNLSDVLLHVNVSDATGRFLEFTAAPTSRVYFTIRPMARDCAAADYFSDRLVDSVTVGSGEYVTGTPVRLVPKFSWDSYPVLSGIAPNQVVYLVNRTDTSVSFVSTLEEAALYDSGRFVDFDSDVSGIDQTATLDLTPVPLDVSGDSVLSESISSDSVDVGSNSVPLASWWLSGTPVVFSGGLAIGVSDGDVYYVCLKYANEGSSASVVSFSDSLTAACLFDRYVHITSTGSGTLRMESSNHSEVLHTGGLRVVLTDSYPSAWLNSTVQTSQTWVDGTPVVVDNVGSGLLPQVAEQYSTLVESEHDLSSIDINEDLGWVYAGSIPAALVEGCSVKLESVGNDIPGGLRKDCPYFVSSVSDIVGGVQFKLATSYHESLIGGGVDIQSVVRDGDLSLSPWQSVSSERVSLGSGGVDVTTGCVSVESGWQTGTPITVQLVGGGALPEGLSADEIYFSHLVSPGKIRVLKDLGAYYRYLYPEEGIAELYPEVADSSGMISGTLDYPPRITAVMDSAGASDVRILTASSLTSLRIYTDRYQAFVNDSSHPLTSSTLIDSVRVGAVEMLPEVGATFFTAVYDPVVGGWYISVDVTPSDTGLVEVAVRKNVDGVYKWSEVWYLMSSQAPATGAYLVNISPGTITDDWTTTGHIGDAVLWDQFAGVFTVYAVIPEALTASDLELLLDFEGASDIYLTTSAENCTAVPQTPFTKMVFPGACPVGISGGLPVVGTVSLVNSSHVGVGVVTSGGSLFLNYVPSAVGAVNGFPVGLSSPGRFVEYASVEDGGSMPTTVFSDDLVLAGNCRSTQIRLVSIGYTEAPSYDLDGSTYQNTLSWESWRSVVVGALCSEVVSFTGADEGVGTIVVEVDGVDLKFNVWEAKGYLTDRQAPFVNCFGVFPTSGNGVYRFQGSGLGTVTDVLFQNEDLLVSEPEILLAQRVRIVERSSSEITVLVPPYTSGANAGLTLKNVRVAFCSPDGTACTEFFYTGAAVSAVVPALYSVAPAYVYYNESEAVGRVDSGQTVTLTGSNLSGVGMVKLVRVEGKGISEFGTYVISEGIVASNTSVSFPLPLLSGLAKSGDEYPTFSVFVDTFFGGENSGTPPVLTCYPQSAADFSTQPLLLSVTPDKGSNTESFSVTILGRNLDNVTSVLFGTQSFLPGSFNVSAGIGTAPDTLQFFSNENVDDGVVSVSVVVGKTNGTTLEYVRSNVLYFTMDSGYYVELGSEGFGEMSVSRKDWTAEYIGTGRVNDSLHLVETATNLPSGLAVRFAVVGGGTLPSGITAGTVYYAVKSPYHRIMLRPHNVPQQGVIDLTAASTGSFLLVDLPEIPSAANPEVEEVDWSAGINRYIEQVDIANSTIDVESNTILVRSAFWDSSRVVTLNKYYPPYLTDTKTPSETQYVSLCSELPTPLVGAYANWKDSWDDPVNDPDREYDVLFPSVQTCFVGVSTTLQGAISSNPSMVPISGGSGFTIEVVSDQVSELFSYDHVSASSNTLTSTDANGLWRTGVPVRLGSELSESFESGGLYKVRRGSLGTGFGLSVGDTGDPDGDLIRFESGTYGYMRLTVTFEPLSRYSTYYVKNVGNGRVRLFSSLLNLAEDSHLRIKVANSSEMLLKPVLESDAVDLSSMTVDVVSSELSKEDNTLVDGSSVVFVAEDGFTEVPEGIELGKTYYVLKTGLDSFRLYTSWLDVARISGSMVQLVPTTGTASMVAVFSGEAVVQSVITEGSPVGNINMEDSTVKLTHSNDPSGTPVILTSDTPVLDVSDMQEDDGYIRTYFPLFYPGGGLTDRVVDNMFEDRVESDRLGVKSAQNTYLVRDYDFPYCYSSGGAQYWDKAFRRLDVESLVPLHPDIDQTDAWKLSSFQGLFRSLEYVDGYAPGGFGLGDLKADEDSYVFTSGTAKTIFLDDLVSPHLRGRDLYISSVVIRVDYSDAVEEEHVRKVVFAGLPTLGEAPSGVYDPAEVFRRVKVQWNRTKRSVILTPVVAGSEDYPVVVTLKLGIVSVNSIPSGNGLASFGSFDVGRVYSVSNQCKEISYVSMKRIIRANTSLDDYGWDSGTTSWKADQSTSDGGVYRDSGGSAWTAWTWDYSTGDETVDLAYTAPAPAMFSGSAKLSMGAADGAFLQSSGLGGIVDTMYLAGWEDNPLPTVPVKRVVGAENDVFVFYNRNPRSFSATPVEGSRILANRTSVVSLAGSGSVESGDQSHYDLLYPYLGFHVLSPFSVNNYSISGIVRECGSANSFRDSSHTEIPVSGFVNTQGASSGRELGAVKKSVGRSVEFVSEGLVVEPFLSADGTEVIIPSDRSGLELNPTRPVESLGSRALFVTPNLVLDKGEVKGVLVVSDGDSVVEASFGLSHRPLVRSSGR